MALTLSLPPERTRETSVSKDARRSIHPAWYTALMTKDHVTVSYGSGLAETLEPGQPLRLSTMTWDFPERPDLIELAERQARLDFLRDHLKALCGLWEKLPRLFLDAYFRDIVHSIRQNRSAIEVLAAAHGGLFDPADWSFAALCPLPRACLTTAPRTRIDFAFWTGTALHAVFIKGLNSLTRGGREDRAHLQQAGIRITEIPGAELEYAAPGDLLPRLPSELTDFWQGVSLPSSPFRIGALEPTRPA